MTQAEDLPPVRRAVRVELLDDDHAGPERIAPAVLDADHRRWPIALMGVALAALVGGLWWAAGLSMTDAPSEEPSIARERLDGDAVAGGDFEGLEGSDAIDGAATESLDSRELFVTLPADLQQVINGPRGLLASGTFYNDVSAEFSEVPALTRTADGRVWTSGTMQNIRAGERIVGLAEYPDETGEGVIAFTVDAPRADDDMSTLRLYGSRGGSDNVWTERNRFVFDGYIRAVTARDGRWVAVMDEQRVVTGTIDGDRIEEFRVGAEELVTSLAPFEDGVLAVVDRLASPGVVGESPPLELRRWRPIDGWDVVIDDLSTAVGPPSRLIDAGTRGAFLSSGPRLFRVDVAGPIDAVHASAEAIFDRIPDGLVPELTPALLDSGYLVVDDVGGETTRLWVSVDGFAWRRHDLHAPMIDVTLLRISNGAALLSGTRDGVEGVLRLDVLGPLPLDVRTDEYREGEWSNPVYAPAVGGGSGFVRLATTLGEADLIESPDGFDVANSTATNLPFGYVANEMTTTSAGYHVVGQIGLIEDAVFISADGAAWERFPIEPPDSATALQIDHFHRTAGAAAMAGSLGWADDLSRTERVVLWWDGAGTQHVVPPRPCPDGFGACTITSLLAVDDGLLVTTHDPDTGSTISGWSEATGWTPRAVVEPDPDERVLLTSSSNDTLWLMGRRQALMSDDAGRSWTASIDAPPGQQGQFIGVSSSGDAAAFESANTLWFLSSGEWTAFHLGGVSVGQLLAITDDSAVLSGVAMREPERSRVLIRLAPPNSR